MSAPKTNIEKQAKRHRGPIWGITIGLILVALVALAAFVWEGIPLDEQAAPDGEETESDTVVAPDVETSGNGTAEEAGAASEGDAGTAQETDTE